MYLKHKNCTWSSLFSILTFLATVALMSLIWSQGFDYSAVVARIQRKGLRRIDNDLDTHAGDEKHELELIETLISLTREGRGGISVPPPPLDGPGKRRWHKPTAPIRRKPRVTPRPYQDVIIITPKQHYIPDQGKPNYKPTQGHELLNAFFDQVVPDYMMGKLNLHIWDRVCGPHVEQLRLSPLFPNFPSMRREARNFRAHFDGTHFGERIFGFLHVSTSGSYQFATTSDDTSELWLSSDSDPRNARLIATVFSPKGIGFTKVGDFQKYPTQISRKIELSKGRKYYIEVLHKQGRGESHLQVLWKKPGTKNYEEISSHQFSMYTDDKEIQARLESDEPLQHHDFELYAPKDAPSIIKRKLDPEIEKYLYKC
ncbi:predicted protein [Nematostella vectensis]|uniref:PA14 domain-containing protein n=1 Tax=Nematostella vectensis TaxID=45351 RepID=A7S4E8_NEMVE|nr:predicted protein [Nematostella vectensis]|eukprot:XP_001633441.1 predicted protein [Nematostella vectensis]